MSRLLFDGVEVADGVHRFGDGHVNWYVLDERDRLVVIDGGMPAHWDSLLGWLTRHRRSLADIEAVVLTHGHGDHMGIVRRVSDEAVVPVHVHHADEALAKGKGMHTLPDRIRRNLWRPRVTSLALRWAAAGAFTSRPILTASTFDDQDILELPGRPRVLHTPGHSPGSSCLHFADRELLISGDALVTLDVVTGRRGMGIMPGTLNDNPVQALASLSALDQVHARTVLPGHGDPYRGDLANALSHARQAGIDWRTPHSTFHGHNH